MIPLTRALNLGRDRTRMKDASDVQRQNETARVLLQRLYDASSPDFSELQLLADEVGMGKTFVALAVAYSVLEAYPWRGVLDGCYRKVLVLVPQNDELFRKWNREVSEIVKRCARPEHRDAAEELFAPKTVERPDELVWALRCGVKRVVIAKTSALGARLKDEELKIRFTLATLFRHFGRALPLEARQLLLKGAPDAWPKDPGALGEMSPEQEKLLLFPRDVLERALRAAANGDLAEQSRALCASCKECGTPHVSRRGEGFDKDIRPKALDFYKQALWTLLGSDLPLVIVDEAHQWKNKKNDFCKFSRFVAPRARRALLLTATPFQLQPSEILALLEVADHLGIPGARRERLAHAREHVVKPALARAELESKAFATKWSTLGMRLDPIALRETWEVPALCAAREELAALAACPGALEEPAVERVVSSARVHIEDAGLRDFVCQALRLYAFNRDLGDELGRFVVRHRRSAHHRIVRAGREIDHDAELLKQRPDAHLLHAAPGIDVRGDDELPLYLLMRATSELEKAGRTASLGSNLTGCYSTFFNSAESAAFAKADAGGTAATYVQLLKELVGDAAADAKHPKMRRVVEEVVERWERGEKSLIFTFRVKTADRLNALIQAEVEARLRARLERVFQGQSGFERFRDRLRRKTDTLYQLLLDRVLWSMLWAPPDEGPPPIDSTRLRPALSDYREVARLALCFGMSGDVLGKTPDRVFLHRAAECSLARRLRDDAAKGSRLRRVLDKMADDTWVERAYGGVEADTDIVSDELADEKGVQSAYERAGKPKGDEVERLTAELLERDRRTQKAGQSAIVRQAFVGPSFWLGADPEAELIERERRPADLEVDHSDQRFLHVHLRELTFAKEVGELDFRTRALAFKAMRRALLRESILARLLPAFEEREDGHWDSLLVRRFTEPVPGRAESMLRLVGVFVEDLAAASGAIDELRSARASFYQATKVAEAVALVKGDTPNDTRSRRFQGFNTPLLPEILICGQIAQEGIDLHRHCSHVVHYDLAWNPATLEQRTGRVDRIGSRTQRLRQLNAVPATDKGEARTDARLEVNAPYLAGTYDERMFEELRLRAQTLEVLLGGDLAGSSTQSAALSDESSNPADGEPVELEGESRAHGLVALPDSMADSLRVDLAVWPPSQPMTVTSD